MNCWRQAVASEASDIHFEPTGADLKVKYRLDGVLNPVESLPAAVADNVMARLKVLGGLADVSQRHSRRKAGSN